MDSNSEFIKKHGNAISKMYLKESKSTYEIAQEFNTYPNKIRRTLKTLGVSLRDKSKAQTVAIKNGRHEHPTQALLDALTIKRRVGRIEGLKIAICGDIANSRVARSNIHLLSTLGAEIRLVCPATLLPDAVDAMGVEIHTNLEQGIEGVDIVMMLRLQTERMEGTETPSQREYFNMFGLDRRKLMRAAPNAKPSRTRSRGPSRQTPLRPSRRCVPRRTRRRWRLCA